MRLFSLSQKIDVGKFEMVSRRLGLSSKSKGLHFVFRLFFFELLFKNIEIFKGSKNPPKECLNLTAEMPA